MGIESYTEPVAALLTYGECQEQEAKEWPNYVEQLGFTPEQIPALIQMATDTELTEFDSDRPEVWAPVHAWRSLAQLKAEAAIAPLIGLFDVEDEYVTEEMPDVFGLIGPAAIPALGDYLADASKDEWGRVTAIDSLEKIGTLYPDYREAAIAPVRAQLEAYETLNDIVLSSVIHNLVRLKAVEAAPTIEKVFASDRVDEMLTGSWPQIQVELGLKQTSDFSPEELKPKMPAVLQEINKMFNTYLVQTRQSKGFGPSVQEKSKKKKKK